MLHIGGLCRSLCLSAALCFVPKRSKIHVVHTCVFEYAERRAHLMSRSENEAGETEQYFELIGVAKS